MATSSSQKVPEIDTDVEESLVPHGDTNDKAQKHASIIGAASIVLFIGLWLLLYFLLPEVPGMQEAAYRLEFTLRCISVVALLTLVLNVQSVSFSRFFLGMPDPATLEGNEPITLRIDQNVLQHTLEQLLLFSISLLGLASYCYDGRKLRAVTATSVTWVIQRWLYWVGYRFDPIWRVPGITSVTQSMVILLYVSARFGFDIAGIAGVIMFLFPFFGSMTMCILGRS